MIGQSLVAIYDHEKMIGDQGKFYFLFPGDEYDLEDDTEACPMLEDTVPGLPEDRKPDKDTWKNLFQVAPTTMSSYAIDLIAP